MSSFFSFLGFDSVRDMVPTLLIGSALLYQLYRSYRRQPLRQPVRGAAAAADNIIHLGVEAQAAQDSVSARLADKFRRRF